MDRSAWMVRHGFWFLALLWLPAGIMAFAALRFGAVGTTFADSGEALGELRSLALVFPCGLPLALGCRRLNRLGYRRAAWVAGVALGALTVPGAVIGGLLGPVAIAGWAMLFSLPVWSAVLWLRRGSRPTSPNRHLP